MRKLANPTAALLLVIGVVLIAIGSVSPRVAKPTLMVDARSKSFGEVHVGDFAAVSFRVFNQTSEPRRILGAARICVRGGCLEGLNLPLIIPPYGSVDVEVGLKTIGPADFQAEITVYTDAADGYFLPLEVTGHISPATTAASPG